MGMDDKLKHGAESTLGKAKESLGRRDGRPRAAGRGKEGPVEVRPEAGRREGQGRSRGSHRKTPAAGDATTQDRRPLPHFRSRRTGAVVHDAAPDLRLTNVRTVPANLSIDHRRPASSRP